MTTTVTAGAGAVVLPKQQQQQQHSLVFPTKEINCPGEDRTSSGTAITVGLLLDEALEKSSCFFEEEEVGHGSSEAPSCVCAEVSTSASSSEGAQGDPNNAAVTPTKKQLEPEAMVFGSNSSSPSKRNKNHINKMVGGGEGAAAEDNISCCSSTAGLDYDDPVEDELLEIVPSKEIGKHTITLPPPPSATQHEDKNSSSSSNSPTATTAATTATSPEDPPGKVKADKRVSFSNLHFREYAMMLGDHPDTVTGPAITLDWQPMQTYCVKLDDYESQLAETTTGRRAAPELRMPAELRHSIVMSTAAAAAAETTAAQQEQDEKVVLVYQQEEEQRLAKEMDEMMQQARKIRHQRRMTCTLYECEFEPVEIVLQSVRRKVGRFIKKQRQQNKKRGAQQDEEDPAARWLQQYKQQQQQAQFQPNTIVRP